jgi:acyl-CoA dehydrogenase
VTADSLIADTAQRIFRELGSSVDANAETALWNALEDAGLTRAWTPQALNGSGSSLADGFEIVRIAAQFPAQTPLAETLLGSWLLAQAELPSPAGALSIAPVDTRDAFAFTDGITGRARAVPFGRNASHLAVLASRGARWHVALVANSAVNFEASSNLAGEPRDTLTLQHALPLASAISDVDLETFLLMGATVRAMQMAGALQTILDMSVAYANERVAFGKPIGKFQAIQHSLAKLAGEVAAAVAASGSAADAIATCTDYDDALLLEVASAKIRVGEAVTAGAAIAHQVHGAIGFSAEHPLHRFTQRLWAWRDDFGSESVWAVRLGALVADRGADALWPMLSAR